MCGEKATKIEVRLSSHHRNNDLQNCSLFQKILAAVDALTRTRPGNVKINFIHKQIFGDLQRTLKVCVLFYGQDLTVHFSFWYGTRDALSCFHVCNHQLFC